MEARLIDLAALGTYTFVMSITPGPNNVMGAACLAYMGWRLLRSGGPGSAESARPQFAWEAAAFQFVNPKAWIMAVTVGVMFLPRSAPLGIAVPMIFAALVIVNFPCLCLWSLITQAASTGPVVKPLPMFMAASLALQWLRTTSSWSAMPARASRVERFMGFLRGKRAGKPIQHLRPTRRH